MAEQEKIGENEGASNEVVARTLRRGNINFDFLNPVQLPQANNERDEDRRSQQRSGKRGLFNRGRKNTVVARAFTWLSLLVLASSVISLGLVWRSEHLLALLAIPFLLSAALASLIYFGLLLARPR